MDKVSNIFHDIKNRTICKSFDTIKINLVLFTINRINPVVSAIHTAISSAVLLANMGISILDSVFIYFNHVLIVHAVISSRVGGKYPVLTKAAHLLLQ